MGWWIIAGSLLVLLIAWRVARRHRQEFLAGVEVYRGPRWRVPRTDYWRFERSVGAVREEEPECQERSGAATPE